jgi:hypothetical protein
MSADLALHRAAASSARIAARSPASQTASSLASARQAAGEEPDALRPVAPDTVTVTVKGAGQPLPSVASARTASGARSLHLLSPSGRNEESAHPRHSKHGDAPPPDPMDHRR